MPINLEIAVESYLRHKDLSRGTRKEYDATLRKWKFWSRNDPQNAVMKWDTKSWGEIPADYGNK